MHAALREAQEELALPSGNVEILGTFDSEYSFGNRSRVWPSVVRPYPTLTHWTTLYG